MSQGNATLLVILVLFVLAIWTIVAPPAGFEELPYRIILPFTLVAVCFGQLENLRTRAHMGELIGAIRTAVGQSRGSGRPEPSPKQKGEAIQILLGSLSADDAQVRRTAAQQLAALTGEDLGDDAGAWKAWWKRNKGRFGG